MAIRLHPDLELLYHFYKEQREHPPQAFAKVSKVIPAPTFFSLQILQQHLNNPLLLPEWVNLVKNEQYLPVTNALLWKTVQEKRLTFMDKDFLNTNIKSGAAVVLEGLDIMDASINTFAAALDDMLPCAMANCVAFFSQSGNEAYRGHRDSDDVLVVQISGEKTWDIFQPQQRRYANNSPLTRAQMGEMLTQVVMKPGDALYVRAGVPHLCLTTGNHSLHLAFDLCDRTPTVEQISHQVNAMYNNASEPPYASPEAVTQRYAQLLQGAEFQDSLKQATQSVRDEAQHFRKRIGNSAKVTALSNYFR